VGIKDKLTNKIVNCPACQQKIRIPVRPGKSLEVRCQKCGTTFQINFQNPVTEVFKYDKQYPLKQNLANMWLNFKRLPQQARLALIAQILMIVLMTFMMLSIARTFLAQDSILQEDAIEKHIRH
jgi:ribosomal protein L37AE/L43A